MTPQTEREVLQGLLPDLEAEGYEVYLHPNRPLLPTFMAGYVPDAIALRSDKNLAIEVVQSSAGVSDKLKRLTSLFKNQDKWELRVLLITPTSTVSSPEVQTPEAIRDRVAEVRDLAAKGLLQPSLLLAWATFEAAARALAPALFERPQTPNRLVQTLAAEGYVTPSEADRLRALSEKRNRLIHGDLQVSISKEELESFLAVLNVMLQTARR